MLGLSKFSNFKTLVESWPKHILFEPWEMTRLAMFLIKEAATTRMHRSFGTMDRSTRCQQLSFDCSNHLGRFRRGAFAMHIGPRAMVDYQRKD